MEKIAELNGEIILPSFESWSELLKICDEAESNDFKGTTKICIYGVPIYYETYIS